MKGTKRFISAFLCVVMTVSVLFELGSVFPKAEAADITIGGLTQTRAVDKALYDGYEKKYLGGFSKQTNLVLPGQAKKDNYTQQGMTYYKAKNWVLITAYDADGTDPTVIYALDVSTGKYVACFKLKYKNGTYSKSHGGGLAASENNLYFADNGSTISYFPLSELDVSDGTTKDVTLVDSIDLKSELNGASTSYCCYDSGILWTGNFYWIGDSSYSKAANSKYDSMIFGYKLSGNTSAEEWANISNANKTNKDCVGNPSYCIALGTDDNYKSKTPYDNKYYDRVQYAMVDEGKLYLSRSWKRKNDNDNYISELDVFDIDLSLPGTETLTIAGKSRDVYLMTSASAREYENMSMSEALCVIDGYLYMVYESGAYTYREKTAGNVAAAPVDVVWKIDQYALMGEERIDDGQHTTTYKRVKNLSEIKSSDQYILCYESDVVDPETGNKYIYAIDSYGGFGENKLAKQKEGTQAGTGDTLGIVGHPISDYTLVNGEDTDYLYLDNAQSDDATNIRWKIVGYDTGSMRIQNVDMYYSSYQNLYFGSKLMYMSMNDRERLSADNATSTNDKLNKIRIEQYNGEGSGSGKFRFFYQGNDKYYIWCNDASNSSYMSQYNAYYQASTGKVYSGLTETAGTFHCDAFASSSVSNKNSGNVLGTGADGTGTRQAADAKYSIISIFKRVTDEISKNGKSDVNTDLKAELTADGTYKVTMEAYATGASQTIRTTTGKPTDFVFVLDSSASMADSDCVSYAGDAGTLTASNYSGKYYKHTDGKYYEIENEIYVYTKQNGDITYNNANDKYLMYNWKYYPITRYDRWNSFNKVYFIYITVNGYNYLVYNSGTDATGPTTNDLNSYLRYSGTSIPNTSDLKDSKQNVYNCYKEKKSGVLYKGDYYTRSTTNVNRLYYQVGNTKYYLTGSGNVTTKAPSGSTDASAALYTGIYYTKNAGNQRYATMKDTVTDFINQIKSDAQTYNVEHRIAIDTYGNGENADYEKTGIYENSGIAIVNYKSMKNDSSLSSSTYKKAFFSASHPYLETIVNKMQVQTNVGTRVDLGLEMAVNALKATGRDYKSGEYNACIIMLTDGIPGLYQDDADSAKTTAEASIKAAKTAKNLGAKVYTVQLGSNYTKGFDMNQYMNYVSSNYPNATSYTSGGTKASDTYYKSAALDGTVNTADALSDIFKTIQDSETDTGTQVKLNGNSYLRQVLGDKFKLTSDSTVSTADASVYYDSLGRLVSDAPVAKTYTTSKSVNNNSVTVNGFDYSTNYVAEGHAGKKLVVTVENVLLNTDTKETGIPITTDAETAIYKDSSAMAVNEPTKGFPQVSFSVPEYDYVLDYGIQMNCDRIESSQLLSVDSAPVKQSPYVVDKTFNTGANIKGVNSKVYMSMGTDGVLGKTTSAFTLVRREQGGYDWYKINIVPASNVYYEENALKTSASGGTAWSSEGTGKNYTQSVSSSSDRYGYDVSAYADNTADGFSDGTALKTTVSASSRKSDKLTFSFTGTGFDLISACGENTGVEVVKISKGGNMVKAYIVDTYLSDTSIMSNGLLRQVPVMRFDSDYGTYDVEITAAYLSNSGAVSRPAKAAARTVSQTLTASETTVEKMLRNAGIYDISASDIELVYQDENSVLNRLDSSGTSNVMRAPARNASASGGSASSAVCYVDGVRIYKPLETDSKSYITSEKDSKYLNVIKNLAVTNDSISAGVTDNIFAYVEGNSYEALNFADYEKIVKTFDGNGNLINYKNGGPENELYLKKSDSTHNSAVTFTVSGLKDYSRVMISLRAVNASTTVRVNNSQFNVNTACEMYYDITPYLTVNNGTATVVISNVGDGLLSIVNLKVSGSVAVNHALQENLKAVRAMMAMPAEYVEVNPAVSDSETILPPEPYVPADDGNTDVGDSNDNVSVFRKIINRIKEFFNKLRNFIIGLFNPEVKK